MKKSILTKGNSRVTLRPIGTQWELVDEYFISCRKAYGCKSTRKISLDHAVEIYNRLLNKGYAVEPIVW